MFHNKFNLIYESFTKIVGKCFIFWVDLQIFDALDLIQKQNIRKKTVKFPILMRFARNLLLKDRNGMN